MKTFPQDWIEFEEIADLEERAKSQFFEKAHEEVVLKTQEAAKEKEFQSVPAGPAGAVEVSFSLPALPYGQLSRVKSCCWTCMQPLHRCCVCVCVRQH